MQDAHRKWWLLAAMSGVLGLIVLDETIVSVSLPTMARDLNLSVPASHWVVNAYLLAFTCTVAIAGQMGDRFSRKHYFATGAALFALASVWAAIATSGTALIAARAAQGVAAAIIFPTSIALITSAFPPEERGRAFGYQTTVGGVFMASGPLVGGLLTQAVSWRLIFWISVPVLALILAILWRCWSTAYDHNNTAAKSSLRDTAGPILLILGLSGTVGSLMQGPDWGWGAPATLVPLAVGLVCLVAFARTERNSAAPLLDLSLLRIPEFGGGVVIFALFQFDKIVVFVFAAQYFQTVLDLTPVMSGLAVSCAILPTLVTSSLVGHASDRFGSRVTLVRGGLIHGGALVLFALATTQDNYVLALVPLILWGASMPSIAIPVRRTQMNAVPMERRARASGLNMTGQMLGGSLGLALCGAILAETNSFVLLFLIVGIAILMAVPIGHRTMAGT